MSAMLAKTSIRLSVSSAATGLRSFIETSGEINEFMKVHVVNLAERGLSQVGKRLYGAKVAVMGLAYKKNINDPRESPSNQGH